MIDISASHYDELFYALSDRTRRQMLMLLTNGPQTVSELVAPFELSKQAVSKHLKVLEHAGLISKEKDGRLQNCSFNAEAMAEVQLIVDQYTQFWDQRLNELNEYIQNKQKGKPHEKSKS